MGSGIQEIVDHLGVPHEVARRMVRQERYAARLMERDPSLYAPTAFTIAGDVVSALYARALLRSNAVPVEKALAFCGSYTRMGMALKHLPFPDLVESLPDLWRGSDPDDTDPRFLAMWRAAFAWNGGLVTDLGDFAGTDKYRPLPSRTWIDVYRGQDKGARPGIAWSLDQKIAEKFAAGAALRMISRDGVILHGKVKRSSIMGYMVGGGESEVIVDPMNVGGWK